MPTYWDDPNQPRLDQAKQDHGNFNHLGYTDVLPGGDVGPHAAFESERIAALRRDSLMQGAGNVLQQGLQSVSSYRPGGLAAATSPFYSQMAGNLQTQASMTQAPTDALTFWWKQDEARRQRKRDTNRYWTGVAVNAAMTFGSAAIGSAFSPPGMQANSNGQQPNGLPFGQSGPPMSPQGQMNGLPYGQSGPPVGIQSNYQGNVPLQGNNSQMQAPGGGQPGQPQPGPGGPAAPPPNQQGPNTFDDQQQGPGQQGPQSQGPGGMNSQGPQSMDGSTGLGFDYQGGLDSPISAALGTGTNNGGMDFGMSPSQWENQSLMSDPGIVAEAATANDFLEASITGMEMLLAQDAMKMARGYVG